MSGAFAAVADVQTPVRAGLGRRLMVRTHADRGVVTLREWAEDGPHLDPGPVIEIPFEAIADVAAALARAYDAIQAGELPRTRVDALARAAAQGRAIGSAE